MRPMRRPRGAFPLMACLGALASIGIIAGCGSGSSQPHRPQAQLTYQPVPNAELYKQIRELPHVIGAPDLGYSDSFGSANAYSGTVIVDKSANALKVLDEVYAVLRQGAPHAGLNAVSVQKPPPENTSTNATALGLVSPSDWDKRYGPQPGNGKPPKH